MGRPVSVACLGDVMLDVIVDAPHGMVPDDDTPARITFAAGGQAANVATWVTALGGRATLYGPRTDHGHGRLVADALGRLGVTVQGPASRRPGTVVSVVSGGTRSMASDPGDPSWLEHVAPGRWLDGADWLFVSGYALLRAPDPFGLADLAAKARRAGTRVAVDLASAAMIEQYGAARFRAAWQALEPSVVLANDAEWEATHRGSPETQPPGRFGRGGRTVLVLKHGPRGAEFVIDGVADQRPSRAREVVDATGAGDALTAGYLVGGADLGLDAAARCVAHVGAQPEPSVTPGTSTDGTGLAAADPELRP